MKVIQVDLDGDQVYRPGSVLSGTVIVQLERPEKFHEIKVIFKGEAYCTWREKRGKTTYIYRGNEIYLNLEYIVWRSESADNFTDFPAGTERYPFRITLPSRIPSFFEGSCGWIRYTVEGRIVTGAFKFDHVHSFRIPVIRTINLNGMQSIRRPVYTEGEKMVCCCCCASGPIKYTVRLPLTGFCTGEGIKFSATIENRSNRKIRGIASLEQTVVYQSNSGYQKKSIKRITSMSSAPIRARTTTIWAPDEGLLVPLSTTCTSTICRVITIIYFFRMGVNTPWGINSGALIPIVIGNVALASGDAHSPDAVIRICDLVTGINIAEQLLADRQRAAAVAGFYPVRNTGLRIQNPKSSDEQPLLSAEPDTNDEADMAEAV